MRGRGQSFEQEKEQTVAVAIDKDRGSEYAIKWAVDSLLTRGQALTLLHVRHPIPGQSSENQMNPQAEELFVSFRSFCAKKNIKCTEIVLEDTNIPNALIKYVKANSIEFLVLGVPTKGGIFRFKLTDVPNSVIKMTPDFCSVCVIAKGKISYMRCATVALPVPHPPSRSNINHQTQHHRNNSNEASDLHYQKPNNRASGKLHCQSGNQQFDEIKSPFSRGKHSMDRSSFEISSDMDISFVSSARPSAERRYPSFYDHMDSGRNSQQKLGSETENRSSVSSNPRSKNSMETNSPRPVFSSSSSDDHSGNSSSSQNNSNLEDVELEMRRLKLELKQTMGMYRTACKEALNAKDKESELNRCKMEEGHRLEEARLAEEAALTLAEREKAKCKAAVEAAAASQRLVELEAQKRRNAEIKSVNVSEDDRKKKTKAVEGRSYDVRYRRYSIEEIEVATGNFSMARKIGEGGYGPVYRGELDHTPVAIKVLRPDSAQGRSQFQQEVEVLSCIRHPNMVLLLGACPEYGCLVYEYMANGSLEDRLFHRGNTRAIPWQVRFRIATEIATGLLFLHQAKPEPLVHRDLKPGNILLDNNYVSKISDVGLARLVPPSVANSVTQYHMTSTAGTFCYIDPEYQQTGMLGAKSDIYSLGVMLLQIITAKPPMGLTHHVERAIEIGTFSEMLDPAITDWPVEEALNFAKLSLQCAEMRKKDRPDLGKVVLPELNRLRAFAEESLQIVMFGGSGAVSLLNRDPNSKSSQDVISRPPSGYDSSRSRTSSTSSNPARLSG